MAGCVDAPVPTSRVATHGRTQKGQFPHAFVFYQVQNCCLQSKRKLASKSHSTSRPCAWPHTSPSG